MGKLFEVEVVENLGPGSVLGPGVPPGSDVKVGQVVMIKRPGLSSLAATVKALASFNRPPGAPVPLLIDLKITARDLPEGSEVWTGE